jgi:hypothetical protein
MPDREDWSSGRLSTALAQAFPRRGNQRGQEEARRPQSPASRSFLATGLAVVLEDFVAIRVSKRLRVEQQRHSKQALAETATVAHGV